MRMMVKLDVSRIERERAKRAWDVSQLAEIANIHINTARKAVYGRPVSLRVVRAIAKAFSLSPSSLVMTGGGESGRENVARPLNGAGAA